MEVLDGEYHGLQEIVFRWRGPLSFNKIKLAEVPGEGLHFDYYQYRRSLLARALRPGLIGWGHDLMEGRKLDDLLAGLERISSTLNSRKIGNGFHVL